MAWNFRTVLQSGTETALDVSDYFVDEVHLPGLQKGTL